MFDWADLRVFLAVTAAGNFTAAAGALKVDQTTVGRRVASLEAALGAKLFRRGRDGLSLTPAGRDVLALARQMEEAAHAIDRGVRGRDQSPAGTVRLTAVESFAARFIGPRLERFRRAYPDVVLEVSANARVESLTRREADVAIRFARPEQPGLVGKKLGVIAHALYGARSYVERRGRSADLRDHEVLGFDDSLSTIPEARWLEERAGGRFAVRTNSLALLEQAVLAGAGLAVLPCYVADGERELVRVVGPEGVVTRDVWLVVHAELKDRAVVRAVTDFIAHEMTVAERALADKKR